MAKKKNKEPPPPEQPQCTELIIAHVKINKWGELELEQLQPPLKEIRKLKKQLRWNELQMHPLTAIQWQLQQHMAEAMARLQQQFHFKIITSRWEKGRHKTQEIKTWFKGVKFTRTKPV